MAPKESMRGDVLPWTGSAQDAAPLLDAIGDARFVLIGEATHGTHEFYRERAAITQRLVLERGFHAVAVEGDWPDAYRVHRYVTAQSADADAVDALSGFNRFPAWMWRNADVLDFVGWLREHNDALATSATKVGFFGLDLYSLYGSIDVILRVLGRIDPAAAARARERYECFEGFAGDTQEYGHAAGLGLSEPCEHQATQALLELRRRSAELAKQDGRALEDELFSIEQNARLVKNAEEYYRSMFGGLVSTWNLRDRHMADTLDAIAAQLDQRVGRSKIVVWEHNSHVGDARATQMGRIGEWNLGQLTRARHPNESFLLGFTTYEGTVTAASAWDGPAERKRVRPGLPGSHEALFHELGLPHFLVLSKAAGGAWRDERLERAIGVVYAPHSERRSHYFDARLFDQFDGVIHIDRTRAVEPLERTPKWHRDEAPETFPFAL
jgi:erythromycin esterase-like protein